MEIRFYHASFMEFLLDQKRSMEFWIKSPRHYHTLALRGLVLSKEIYEMNGLSRDEKCRRLHETLSACPIEDINPSICLEMRKELFYGYLTRDLFTWCAKADSSIELSNAVRGISNSVSFHHLFASGDSYAETVLLNDMSKPYLHFQDCRERWGLPSPLKSEIEIHRISFGVAAPSAWKEAWAPLATMITGGSSMSEPELKKVHRLLPDAKNSDFYAYFKSQVRQYFDEFIKGALGRAESSRRLLHSRAKLFRVTEKYFRFDRAVILDDVQIPTLERVVQCLNNEYSGLSSLCGFPVPGNWSQVVMDMCWEILLLEHREEFSRILEELLLSGTSAHDRINLFRTFLRFSPNGTRAIFEEQAKSYLESTTSYAVPRSPENVNISSLDRHSVELASTLLDTKEQLRIKAEWIAGPKICDVVDREWDEFLAGHPMYRDTVDDYLAGEEGKVFRRLFDMPYDLVFEVDSEDPESKNSSLGGDEQTQAIHNYPDSIQQPSHIKVIVTNSASSTSPPSANEGKPDGDGNQSASESAPAVHTSSTRAQHTEKKSTKKGDKVVRFFRRTFKRS
ncbi:hypothetical protein NP233_g9117 [Leucocoprinus birnbaumii]|uniref:Uncharacterized protein n=1 Tax=Leucocoprinus birnbaumii TaxID=56174 RepID=A0AAD5VLC5_9AGAR|nr:hypothetical protein NP233_g9117 [Leucocoprinus birnbaumii]